ncbi:hypothetical protein [Nocardioides terrae]|uniref:hypothetical protein n=1 Tax=Nocardioides terrae TaxID=574651 RepID=UPI000B82706A|nr:hypothetical protein [Nocardioides terrae]
MNLGLDTSSSGLAGAPPAQRVPRAGWRDPRLWVGAALVAVSVVAGARLLAASDDTVRVWAAGDDLAAGAPVTAADLEQHRVRFADGDDVGGYFRATEPPDGVLLRGVGAGELVPRSAVGAADQNGTVQVPLAVDPEQVPPSVGTGSVVDVYLLGGPVDGARDADAEPVLAGVSVVDAPAVEDSFVASGKRQLVLAVPEDDAHRFFGLVGAADSPTLTVVRRS